MEIFCKSPSSTAICSSLDHRSMVRHHYSSTPSTPKTPIFTPCSSNDLLPFHPSDNLRRRSTTVALADLYRKSSASDNPKQSTPRRRSAADIADLLRLRHRHSRSGSSAHLLNHDPPAAAAESDQQNRNKMKLKSSVYDYAPIREIERRHSSAAATSGDRVKRTELIGWVRSDSSDKNGAVSEIVPFALTTRYVENRVYHAITILPLISTRIYDSIRRFQVVELRVSIHCKGCEGKVRKHISKMEGVTSFSIDVATKKVTVKGNVTPMGVLASISKVKSAQLWSAEFLPPRPPSAAAAATPRWSN
ncbi:Protein SODIUM POTASSIUM ROOT DEFECTIVE 2 [Linum perenne]